MLRRGLGVAVAVVAACSLLGLIVLSGHRGHSARDTLARAPASASTPTSASTSTSTTSTSTTSTTTTTLPPPTTAPTTAPTVSAAAAPATLAGCPVAPPRGPSGPTPPPWHPATLVPDSALPAVQQPAPWHSSLSAIDGKGMWIWLWSGTEGGNAKAVVQRAVAAGLHQLWVRVGDSKNGFYGATELQALVPLAHSAGLAVVGWGFPYLYDPVGDAGWTAQILAWRSPDGQGVDAYSADIERPSEGVDLSAKRVAVYLEGVRKAARATPVVATVYPPLPAYWNGSYPYTTMATYVDAFAPMVYWECIDPGTAAATAIQRLSTLRPVHVIGQAFSMADVGGRVPAPSAGEITEFLDQAHRSGAVGGSFWVWQSADPEEWAALSAFRW